MIVTYDESLAETVRLTEIRLDTLHTSVIALQAQVFSSRQALDESREMLWRIRQGRALTSTRTSRGKGVRSRGGRTG